VQELPHLFKCTVYQGTQPARVMRNMQELPLLKYRKTNILNQIGKKRKSSLLDNHLPLLSRSTIIKLPPSVLCVKIQLLILKLVHYQITFYDASIIKDSAKASILYGTVVFYLILLFNILSFFCFFADLITLSLN